MPKKPTTTSENIFMTPEYLYKEGIKLYKKALEEEFEENKGFDKAKEIYLNAILYLQGAMLLGNDDACAYLSEFYSRENHLGIDNKNLSNLVKTIGTIGKFNHYSNITKSVCLRDFGIASNTDIEELAFIEDGIIKTRNKQWDKIPVPKYLIISNILSIIKEFNSAVLSEYQLITDTSIFECKEEIEEFTVLNNKQLPQSPIPEKSLTSWNDNLYKIKSTDEQPTSLSGAELCTIS